jgi:hypothetical protein
MGNDPSKRACGGPNPLVVQLRGRVDELEGDKAELEHSLKERTEQVRGEAWLGEEDRIAPTARTRPHTRTLAAAARVRAKGPQRAARGL